MDYLLTSHFEYSNVTIPFRRILLLVVVVGSSTSVTCSEHSSEDTVGSHVDYPHEFHFEYNNEESGE